MTKTVPAGSESAGSMQTIEAFRLALQEGQKDKVEEYLNNGLNPGLDFGGGVTPLHIAIQEGRTAAVQVLLKRGADPNAVTRVGWTSLHMVALTDNAEIGRLLLEYGADGRKANDLGHTPADLAKAHNKLNVLALLKASKKSWQFWK